VVKVNLPLPDARLKLFIEGEKDLLEEGLLVLARKKQERKNYRGMIFRIPKTRGCTTS
jgi:hypothetical protein